MAAALACTLALAPATALAQRGNSGLPANPGNPIADLQRQIDELRAIVDGLVGTPTAVTVNCGLGQTIGATLAAYTGPLTITVAGTCTENVVISRDDIVLQGASGAGVTGASASSPVIRLDGAHRVRISGLTLTGGDSGLSGQRGSTFDLSNCTVQNGARFGVTATNGTTGSIDGCLVGPSGGQGVVAANESAIHLTNSTVENHASQGVVASRNSHVRVGQDISSTNVVKPVTIRNNSGNGVTIVDSSAGIVVGSTIENNGNTGIFVGRSSSAQIGVGSLGLTAGVLVQGSGHHGISVESSQATILGSTITANDDVGIIVSNAGGARIGITDGSTGYNGNTISANGSNGIQVVGAASAFIGANTITGNGTTVGAALGRNGIAVFSASAHLAGGNVISNNAGAGISAVRNAAVLVGDPGFGLPVTGASMNQITGNGSLDPGTKGGINVFEGAAVEVRDSVISGNYGAGAQAFEGGIIDVRRTQISGSIYQASVPPPPQLFDSNGGHGIVAGFKSIVRVRGTTSITGNQGTGVRVFNASAVDFRNEGGFAPQVNGNGLVDLDCGGAESSFSGDVSGVADGIGTCTGF